MAVLLGREPPASFRGGAGGERAAGGRRCARSRPGPRQAATGTARASAAAITTTPKGRGRSKLLRRVSPPGRRSPSHLFIKNGVLIIRNPGRPVKQTGPSGRGFGRRPCFGDRPLDGGAARHQDGAARVHPPTPNEQRLMATTYTSTLEVNVWKEHT